MKVYVIGIGLIGGSMSKDLKDLYPGIKISGIDVNEQHIREALSLGLIDESASIDSLSKEQASKELQNIKSATESSGNKKIKGKV